MRRRLPLLLSWVPLVTACPDSGDKGVNESTVAGLWCESAEDADTYYIEDGGGTGTSGRLVGRVVSTGADDIHDPNLIGNIDYTVESETSGGAPSTGSTDSYGDFTRTLGEGTWRLQATKSTAGNTCRADYTFEIVADKTTYICVDLVCQ